MKALGLASLALAAYGAAAALESPLDGQAVTLVTRPSDRRVDVLVGGQPFTSYIYPASLEKPVLYPIRTARGTLVTRGYPLEPRPGERADHPHHVGHWFNYGDVNGYDFWGHSSETPTELKAKAGTIVHKEIAQAASGPARGELAVKADWVVPDGSVLIHEQTRFVFAGGQGRRAVDRVTTWTAAEKRVVFGDTKEGAFGLRVARALEHPSKEAEVFVSARGRKGDRAAPGQHRRDRAISRQRWHDRRGGLGDARTVDGIDRSRRWPAGDDRDSRSSLQPRPPDLLARSRVRSIRREPARPACLRSEATAHRARARSR